MKPKLLAKFQNAQQPLTLLESWPLPRDTWPSLCFGASVPAVPYTQMLPPPIQMERSTSHAYPGFHKKSVPDKVPPQQCLTTPPYFDFLISLFSVLSNPL